MATWKSPIFSDIRNKLGENVVFSMWKGRPYMRSYVKPSNPDTVAQQANRADMTSLVSNWQSTKAITPATVTAWNAAALSDLISGYNRFIKGMRGFVLDGAPTLAHGSFSITLASTKLPLNQQVLVAVDVSESAVVIAGKQTIAEYTAADFSGLTPAAGDYFVVWDLGASDGAAATFGTIADYGAPLNYVDEANGVLVPCVLS